MIAALVFALALSVYLYFVLLRRGETEWRVHLLFALIFATVAYVSVASANVPAGEVCTTTTTTDPLTEQTVTNSTCTAVYRSDASAMATLIMSATLAVALFVYATLAATAKTLDNA
ncbi:MAG: hypothetical protein QXT27_02755 [Pyrobaculum sp.]